MLSKYKDILGMPGKGIHSFRIFNIAVMDVLFTIIGGILISKYYNINMYLCIICLFILGIILHKIFYVKTTFDKYLFR